MFNDKTTFKEEYTEKIVSTYGRSVEETSAIERYLMLGEMIRAYATENWYRTQMALREQQTKMVYYFSLEFLIGRSLENNLKSLGLYEMVRDGLKELKVDYEELKEAEAEPGLGNGGLGRLAACYMESSSTLNLPVRGICIRYKYGLFRQEIDAQGNQVEKPDMWLKDGFPWEVRQPNEAVEVDFYGSIDTSVDAGGDLRFRHYNTVKVAAVPYDVPVIGSGTEMTNNLRLWSAEPSAQAPENQDYRKYLSDVDAICQNLYPDDSTEEGKMLRLKQQYFFVSAGVQTLVRMHMERYGTLDNLAEKAVVQLNDTHPVLAIPEMMRILMDEYLMSWQKAFEITWNVMAYTNHTVMQEALERWPAGMIQKLLPRIYLIIEEMDRRYAASVLSQYPNRWGMVQRTRILSDGLVHMANLAVIGCHSINGVAKIHTGIIENGLFKDFYEMWPERFSNKTNGVTPRRFLLYGNPELSAFLDDVVGTGYRKDLSELEKLMDFVDDPIVQDRFLAVKQQRKDLLADRIYRDTGVIVYRHSIFDVQAKRLHGYKRQLLAILYVISLYQKIKENPSMMIEPHTFIFAAKAAASYRFAKAVIRLINAVGRKINNDPDVKGQLKVVFLPNYRVTMAEYLTNGADISEQISMAGTEASGTGNMKFMMNGTITLGTLDGANVEIDALVGRENDVIFGMNVDEIRNRKPSYQALELYNSNVTIRKAVSSLIDGTWSENRDDFRIIYEELIRKNDEYMVLADFDAYAKAQEEIQKRYHDRRNWAKSCLVNIAKSGYFSSDRAVQEYADEIWHVSPVTLKEDESVS